MEAALMRILTCNRPLEGRDVCRCAVPENTGTERTDKSAYAAESKRRGGSFPLHESQSAGCNPWTEPARSKLLFAGELDGNAEKKLAIIFFHLPQQAADAVDEGAPLPRESPFLRG